MKELVFYPTTRDGREGLWLKYTSLEEKYDEWKKWKEKKNNIPKSTTSHKVDGLVYTLVRTYSAGVFCGFIQKKKGKECTLLNARRLWYWDGAASLSQLSQEGVSKPKSCKFPVEIPEIELTECIEYIPMAEKAVLSIANVPVWSQ